jgi:hypothetical protein
MGRSLALLFILLAACVPDRGPLMAPGEDCLSCHSRGGGARPWTVAGTVLAAPDAAVEDGVQGATVVLTDARGRTLELRTNQAGNFYSAESLALPLRVAVRRGATVREMGFLVQYGGCNSCHAYPGRGWLSL